MSVILPILLRMRLVPEWIHESFRTATLHVFAKESPNPSSDSAVVDSIVRVFARIARSNSVLVSRSMTNAERRELKTIIFNGRNGLQMLFEAAAVAAEEINPARARSNSVSESPAASSMKSFVV